MIATKQCPKCKKVKLLRAFGKNRSRQDGYAYACKICANGYRRRRYAASGKVRGKRAALSKQWEKKNQERRRSRGRQYAKTTRWARKKEAHVFIVAYKAGRCCKECGSRHALCFHHIGQKNYEISRMVERGRTLAAIRTEIGLCVLLCRVCHAKIHAKKRAGRR